VSALPTRRGGLALLLERAEAWLLEPEAEPYGAPAMPEPAQPPLAPTRRVVVAVFGLARGAGATVVARGLAAELAGRDPAAAAAVSCSLPAAGVPLASPAAGRLAGTLADLPHARTRAVGRVCLVETSDELALVDTARHHAPLVLDAGGAVVGGAPAAIADQALLVGSPRLEPALASAAAASLARVVGEPLVVLNRGAGDEGWEGRAAVELPESRMGAQLALAGREPRGELGRAVAELADLCEERAS